MDFIPVISIFKTVKMEDVIGLKPSVIDFFQKEMIKKNELFYPIMIDLRENQGVEMKVFLGLMKITISGWGLWNCLRHWVSGGSFERQENFIYENIH